MIAGSEPRAAILIPYDPPHSRVSSWSAQNMGQTDWRIEICVRLNPAKVRKLIFA